MNRLLSDTSGPLRPSPEIDFGDGGAPDAAPAVNPLLRVHALLRGRYLITLLLAVVGIAVGGAVGYRTQTPLYESTGLVHIKAIMPPILDQNDMNGVMPRFDSYVDLQVALMSGERVIKMAMEDPEWVELGRGLSPEAAVAMTKSLTVARPKGSELIIVKFTDPDPVAAQKGVAAIIRAYQRRHGDEDPNGVGRRIAVLEERKGVFAGELAALNNRIRDIARQFGSPDIEKIHDFRFIGVQKLEAELKQAELAVALASGHPEATPATRPANPGGPADPTPPQRSVDELALISPELGNLLASKRALERSIRVDRTRLGPQHAKVLEAEASLSETERQVQDVAATVRRLQAAGLVHGGGGDNAVTPGIGKSLDRLRAEEQNVRLLLEETKAATDELGRQVVEVGALKDETAAVKAKLEDTKRRIDQLNLESSGSIGGRINVESWGDRPFAPAKDKRKTAAAAGAAGLGGAGVGLMLLLGFCDRRVRHLDDVHQGMRHTNRVLGVLPHLPDGPTDPEQAGMAAHAVHQLRTLLQRRRALTEKPVFAITSASPGAGKTSLTLALGLSYAASGAKTLLIDCDIIGGGLTSKMKRTARRRLGHILRREELINNAQLAAGLAVAKRTGCRIGQALVAEGFVTTDDVEQAMALQADERVGLREALSGEPVGECITGTGTAGLFIMPLGSAHRHHAAQLSYPALRALLTQVRPWFDVILIDTGPILGSIEASVVAMAADEVVLTVARGEQRPLIQRAAEQLLAAGANVAGIVLNRADTTDVQTSRFSSSSAQMDEVLEPHAPLNRGEHKYLRLGPIATAVAAQTDLTGPGGNRLTRIAAESGTLS